MISAETKGRYLAPESVEEYEAEVQKRRQKKLREEREAAIRRLGCWGGLALLGGGLVAMILQGLIDQRIGVAVLAVSCAALGRGTK